MKSFAVISVLASVALAQTASTATSPLIPSGLSSGCSQFLNTLNSDNSLSGCLNALISATSQLLNSTSAAPAVSSVVSSVCSASSQCSAAVLRPDLTSFYQSCSDDLAVNPIPDLVSLYDAFYTIIPLSQSICAKDDSGNSCVGQIKANVASASLYTNVGSAGQTVLKPNAQTIASDNIIFLGLNANLPKEQLCTACTRNVLTSYINFQTSTPYGPGMSNTEFFTGQSALYSAVQTQCGSSFLAGTVAAGSLSGSVVGGSSSDAPRNAARVGALTVILGALAAVFAAAL